MSLTYERAAEVLRYDPIEGRLFWLERPGNNNFNSKHAGKEAFTAFTNGYKQGTIDGKQYRAHRICWLLYYGKWPDKDLDHRDRDGCNNRIDNLRESSHAMNCRNRGVRSDNSSGYPGVGRNKVGGWFAAITKDGSTHYLGQFDDFESAKQARIQAEKDLDWEVA